MTQSIVCPADVPEWPRVAAWLSEHGMPVQMRMIDGELAFPDEEPPSDWKELRVASTLGMVTIRRSAGGVELVVWGNADAGTQQTANALALAFATLGGNNGNPQPVDLPPGFRFEGAT